MRWIGLLGLVIVLPGAPASAHAFLERASPPVGSDTATSPSELTLTFTEGVEPLFSTIELRGPNNTVISIGKPHLPSGNDRRLAVGLPRLSPGTYTVIWHATSVDTHKTEGSYRFSVAH
jgi:copper resistance protein C